MTQSVETPSLLDLLAGLADAPATDGAELALRAERLIEFSLAEYERIVGLDEDLGKDRCRLALQYSERRDAFAMRRLYQDWAAEADRLLDQVRALGLRQRLAAGYERLNAAVGRTQAMLTITLESLERADEQIRRGEAIPIEEVRRELRSRPRA